MNLHTHMHRIIIKEKSLKLRCTEQEINCGPWLKTTLTCAIHFSVINKHMVMNLQDP